MSMATNLQYWENTFLFESTATVVEVKTGEDGKVNVVLDKTIFYPAGGIIF